MLAPHQAAECPLSNEPEKLIQLSPDSNKPIGMEFKPVPVSRSQALNLCSRVIRISARKKKAELGLI
jgi:hypothetical protein